MRRVSIPAITALLILSLGASTSMCLAGSTNLAAQTCHRRGAPHACSGATRHVASAAHQHGCDELKTQVAGCGVRGLDQIQFAGFIPPAVSPPSLIAVKVIAQRSLAPASSSVGFPETDRGPPRS
jgi:hypothetical protein